MKQEKKKQQINYYANWFQNRKKQSVDKIKWPYKRKNRVADLGVAQKLKIEFTDLQNQLAALNDTWLIELLQMLQGTYANTAKLLFWLLKYLRIGTLLQEP